MLEAASSYQLAKHMQKVLSLVRLVLQFLFLPLLQAILGFL